jgi:rare lipoprotein A (peptidoglycan hydrolase)
MRRRRTTLALAVLTAGFSLACGGVALAGSGGVGTGGGSPSGSTSADTSYQKVGFGKRDLRRGNRGDDVKTLHWLLLAQTLGAPKGADFVGKTESAVRKFQAAVGVKKTGVVKKSTRKGFAKRMPIGNATWYGPGFWGNRTACGQTLKPTTVGVAHKKLPCGTRVTFAYRGRWVRAKVIDRGPYNAGYQWDLTRKLAKRLGFINVGAGSLRVAVAK